MEAVLVLNQLAFGRDNESRLVERLRKTEAFVPELSLVAVRQQEIVGYILFTRIKIQGETSHESLALAPMAVHPEHQRAGIGRELIRAGLARAEDLGFDSVIVLGHPGYYPRFGFQRASRWGIRCPFDVPDEAFLALGLREGALRGKDGTVQYADPFYE